MLKRIKLGKCFEKLMKEKESLLQYQDKVCMKIADEKFQEAQSEFHACLL